MVPCAAAPSTCVIHAWTKWAFRTPGLCRWSGRRRWREKPWPCDAEPCVAVLLFTAASEIEHLCETRKGSRAPAVVHYRDRESGHLTKTWQMISDQSLTCDMFQYDGTCARARAGDDW